MTTTKVHIAPVDIEDRRNIGIRSGDTVRVWQKVEEKGKTRLQPFEGVVLARKHGSEPGATFTVRRTNDPYGVEKIFPLYSPMIDKIEIVKRAKVRRAKLYHIRRKAAREIRRQMRNAQFVDIATKSDLEAEAEKEKAKQANAESAEEKEQASTEVAEKQGDESADKKEQAPEAAAEPTEENQEA